MPGDERCWGRSGDTMGEEKLQKPKLGLEK